VSTLLNIKQLSVALQKKQILAGVDLSLASGEILGLVGPSGCGKTTLLNTIAGFIKQSAGELTLDGQLLLANDCFVPPEQRNIGMIFQDYALFPHLTVEQNIVFGIDKLSKSEQKSRLEQLMSLLKLTGLAQRFPHQLSGGQQQRVAIARALAPQPKLLLLDEPFSNIDARLRNELMLEMRQLLKKLAISAIFVTHNKDEVFTFADKIAVMNQGGVLQTGAPAIVCQQPNSWQVADFLQLGSWVPLKESNTANKIYQSAFGEITLAEKTASNSPQLLIKPQFIELLPIGEANAQVKHISVTERGYHYLFNSIISNSELAFDQLSFYSDQLLAIGDKVVLSLKPHTFLVFNK